MAGGDKYFIHPTHHEELFGSDRPVSAGEMKLAVFGMLSVEDVVTPNGEWRVPEERRDRYLTFIVSNLVINTAPEKTMRTERYAKLMESVKENGIMRPPLVWIREDGKYWVYEGHHRFAAAKIHKIEKVRTLLMIHVADNYPNNIINKNAMPKREFDWLIHTFQKEKHVKLYDPPENTEFKEDTISLDEWYMLHRFLNKCKPKRILEFGHGPSTVLFQAWTDHKIEKGHGIEMSIENPQGQYDFAFVDKVSEQKIKRAEMHTDAILVHEIDRDSVMNIIWNNLPGWKRTDFEDCPRLALFERPSSLEIDKKFDKQPFITIITRTCRRPVGLVETTKTIDNQIDNDYQHLIIVDRVGKGLFSAGKSIWENRHRVKGRWIYILDDDVRLINDKFITRLKETVSLNPDAQILMVRNYFGSRELPSPNVWGGKAVYFGTIDSASFVVCRELFDKYIHTHARHKGSDYAFINGLFHLTPLPKVCWIDKFMTRTGGTGQGMREAES